MDPTVLPKGLRLSVYIGRALLSCDNYPEYQVKTKPAETELQPRAPGRCYTRAIKYECPPAWVWILALLLATLRPGANYLISLGLRFFTSNMEILRVSASVGPRGSEGISHKRLLKNTKMHV